MDFLYWVFVGVVLGGYAAALLLESVPLRVTLALLVTALVIWAGTQAD